MRYIFLTIAIAFIFSGRVSAQNEFKYTGKVMDSVSGFPLESATITLSAGKAARVLGVSQPDGSFTFSVPANATLILSYAGYKERKIKPVPSDSTVVLLMQAKHNAQDDEVIVVGVNKVSRVLNPGSSTIISAAQLRDQPAASVESLLQGKVAGLNIQNNTGAPGVRGTALLRGLSNISIQGGDQNAYLTPTSPLYVIDGVMIDGNTDYGYGAGNAGSSPLSVIPIEDIESVQILKDAASTAMYGSRGAYGVYVITTKRSQSARPQFSLTSSVFYSAVPPLRKIIGGRKERDIRLNQLLTYDTSLSHALGIISGIPYYSDSLNAFYNNSVDWQALLYKPTFNTSEVLSVRGGTNDKASGKGFTYATTLGYYNQPGILRNTGYTKYTLGTKLVYTTPKLELNFNYSSGIDILGLGSGNAISQSGVASAASASTLLPPPSLSSGNTGAVAGILEKNDNKSYKIYPFFSANWRPIQNLSLRSEISYSFQSSSIDDFKPSYINAGNTAYNTSNRRTYGYRNLNVANYTYNFGKGEDKPHGIIATFLTEFSKDVSRGNMYFLTGIANDQSYTPASYDFWASKGGVLDNITDTRRVGYRGSLTYNYKLRYVLWAQSGADAASTNGPNQGYVKNTSIAFRWNMEKEKWLQDVKWINGSAIRLSYGTQITPQGDIFSVYGKYQPGASYVGQPTIGFDYSYLPNVNFTPFSNKSLGIGYEGSFFNNRLAIQYDFYYSMKDNNAAKLTLANTTGFDAIQTNDRSLVSVGHEIDLRYMAPRMGKFNWNVGLVGAYDRDVLTHLEGNQSEYVQIIKDPRQVNIPVLIRVGNHPISALSYNTVGVYATNKDVQVDPLTGYRLRVNGVPLKAGDPRWTDLNGDYLIDNNDVVALYNPLPLITGGFNMGVTYKDRWSFNTQFSFTLIRDVVNTAIADKFLSLYNPLSLSSSDYIYKKAAIPPVDDYNYWKQNGDNAKYPNPFDYRYTSGIDPYRYNQSLFFEDGSYVKVNLISLSYTLNPNFIKRFGVTYARASLSAQNIYYFTRYTGPNPEAVTSLGFDGSGGYPPPKTVSASLTVTF
ncbi:MAG: SusC/RagA family TonB-linked outer membrane protein [Niabella sp.]|nr:SusC/RagA family TonB-linked outer membrane protein [Niabella sp.]